ncbi:MAG TPA: TetR/AcrR family transcriptional regulator, partial [Gammaproteobacteria bacterium]|nr:TetR/AcrR family transcriptional regulator [Gammaproteobacteria bacterium]
AEHRSRRGREANRRAMLEAAAQAFFEHGYEGTSIDAVIERVGGSKRTLYAHFGKKRELFTAIVTEHLDRMTAALVPGEAQDGDLRSALHAYGMRLLEALSSPMTVALYATVIGESRRFPELARTFFERGPNSAVERLADLLETHRRRGGVEIDDPRRAAESLVGMLRGNLLMAMVLGVRKAPRTKETKARVAEAVETFLEGVGAGAGKTKLAPPPAHRRRPRC